MIGTCVLLAAWVLLGAILVSLPGAPAYSVHRHDQRHHSKRVEDEPASPVLWGRQCTPRLAFLRPQQDTLLECEVLAPTGTVLTWYKDQVPLDGQMDVVKETSNSLWEPRAAFMRSTSKVHLSSVLYIDCAEVKDQGHYRLEVRTPDDQLYTRHFTVNLTKSEGETPGNTCRLGREVVSHLPRIHQYAQQAMAHHGQDLLLPCRLHGRAPAMATTWLFRDTKVASHHHRYQVLPTGDLLVREVRPEDRGIYTCKAYSTLLPGFTDQIHTFVYPLEQVSLAEFPPIPNAE
ncbi:neural/ectodermal development factor IMP-L2 [Panulirus ornatus]|uniref:neural/ectodermal development factor IMP-L2 n=1 Tax=Panulirus ornatus TaxID=150431 RepID=UPI003A85A9B9